MHQVCQEKFDYICGIPRGGLIPAIILSHELEVPYLHDIESAPSNTKILVVDEISETGKTFLNLQRQTTNLTKHNNVKFEYAALYVRSNSQFVPKFYAEILIDDTWLQMPFESVTSSLEKPKSWQ